MALLNQRGVELDQLLEDGVRGIKEGILEVDESKVWILSSHEDVLESLFQALFFGALVARCHQHLDEVMKVADLWHILQFFFDKVVAEEAEVAIGNF